MNTLITAGSMAAVMVMIPLQVLAAPSLGPEPSTFSVPGTATVINTDATTLTGDPGVVPGSAITGTATITVNGSNAAVAGNPSVQEAQDSRGSSGGLDIPPGGVVPVPLQFARVPEPAVLLLFAAGLLALFFLATRRDGRRCQPRSDGSTDSENDEPQAPRRPDDR